jgi:HlyD family secretion protein
MNIFKSRLQSMPMKRGVSISAILLLCVAVIVVIVWAIPTGGSSDRGSLGAGALYEVVRGSFEITVPTSGELSALEQVNIYNSLESNAVIIELVDEGSRVEAGDVLLRLNDETIQNAIRSAEDGVTTSVNTLDGSTANLVILNKKRDSELAIKQLAVDLAVLALQSWERGEVVARKQSLNLAVQTAEKDFTRLSGKFKSSLKLYEQEFLSKDELDRDEIALLKADAQLKKALLDVDVYNNYTFKQDKQKKESDLQQAKDELERAIERLASEIRGAESNVLAAQKKLANKQEGLQKLEDQLEMCVVTSPANGMVVYASSLGEERQRDGEPIKIGKKLYRNELCMIIPNTEIMVAEVKVNEALSGLIKDGQQASIICDAFPDELFKGEVVSVGVLASGGGWRDPNRRDYTIKLQLTGENIVGLKPSMRCSAEILVSVAENQLFVPIHAIHRKRGTIWVWLQKGGGFEQRVVTVGQFSESFTVIEDGLVEGDVILLREPPPRMVTGTISNSNEEQ